MFKGDWGARRQESPLRVMERDDIGFVVECRNDIEAFGQYDPVSQISKTERMKEFDNPTQISALTETTRFIIENKERKRIGYIRHYLVQPIGHMEIGYGIVPSDRGKGYGTEAVQIMVDYLFLSKNIMRIQAGTNVRNRASQRVLEKAGFKKEGTIRKSTFVRGEWADAYLYSIIKEQ